MSTGEELRNRLHQISDEHDCDLIEACTIFIEENDMDIAEFMKQIDPNTAEEIKYAAISLRKVQKKVGGNIVNMWG